MYIYTCSRCRCRCPYYIVRYVYRFWAYCIHTRRTRVCITFVRAPFLFIAAVLYNMYTYMNGNAKRPTTSGDEGLLKIRSLHATRTRRMRRAAIEQPYPHCLLAHTRPSIFIGRVCCSYRRRRRRRWPPRARRGVAYIRSKQPFPLNTGTLLEKKKKTATISGEFYITTCQKRKTYEDLLLLLLLLFDPSIPIVFCRGVL